MPPSIWFGTLAAVILDEILVRIVRIRPPARALVGVCRAEVDRDVAFDGMACADTSIYGCCYWILKKYPENEIISGSKNN